MLDVAREAYRENVSDLFELTSSYAGNYIKWNQISILTFIEKYDLPITCTFVNNAFNMMLKFSDIGGNELPKEFINVIKVNVNSRSNSENISGRYRFTTLELLKRNSRISDALSEVYLLSCQCVMELRDCVIRYIPQLYQVSDAISLLDVIFSLANAAISRFDILS